MLLRVLNEDRKTRGATLSSTLLSALKARYDQTIEGSVLVGVSSNGSTVNYEVPRVGYAITPAQIALATEELMTRSEKAISDLALQGVATPTDDQIFSEMMANLVAITSRRTDYLDMRIA